VVDAFTREALDRWAYENDVTLDFSRPGKPTDNASVESFNGRLRDACLRLLRPRSDEVTIDRAWDEAIVTDSPATRAFGGCGPARTSFALHSKPRAQRLQSTSRTRWSIRPK